MTIDTRTIYLMTFAIYIAIAAFMYVIQRQFRFKGYWWWILSALSVATGMGLLSLRGIINDSFSILLGNLFVTLYFIAIALGIQAFFKDQEKYLYAILILFAEMIFLGYYTYISPNVLARVYVFTITVTTISIYTVYYIKKRSVVFNIERNYLITGSLFITILVGLFRLVLAHRSINIENSFFTTNLEGLVIMSGLIAFLMMFFGVVSLNGQVFSRDNIMNLKKVTDIAKKLKKAQEIASLGNWELNIKDNALYWSDQIYKIFDCEPKEFEETYEAFLSFVHPDDREMVNEFYLKSLENKVPYEIEHRVVTKENKIKYVLEKCETEFDSEGNPLISSGIVLDITKIKETQKALKIAKERAEKSERRLAKANKTKDKFLSIIAHDLKGPFNAIQGLSSLLLEDIDNETLDKVTIKKYADLIHISSTKATKLLGDLMDWSLAESDGIKFTPEQFDLIDLINENRELLVSALKLKGLRLNEHTPTTLMINIDRDMINTVLRNLLSNAIKYTPRGKAIEIRILEKKNKITVSVEDQGIGMDDELKSKLFSIEDISPMPGTEQEIGTGFGLALCKKFVNRHGGKIWVESELGKGSTFSFSIPRHPNNP